jgi:succinate dehydrogenase / fumarate reductase cytochrome b subunit
MASTKSDRPLSPHLQIYKPMLTMMLSIVHRMTGAALYFGTLLLCWWLIAAAVGPEYFAFVQDFMAGFLGRLILFGYTWALVHHMFGGLRHLIWDTGNGFELPTAEFMARLTIGGSVITTLVIWTAGYWMMGALS